MLGVAGSSPVHRNVMQDLSDPVHWSIFYTEHLHRRLAKVQPYEDYDVLRSWIGIWKSRQLSKE
jgi:hypothetical protein